MSREKQKHPKTGGVEQTPKYVALFPPFPNTEERKKQKTEKSTAVKRKA